MTHSLAIVANSSRFGSETTIWDSRVPWGGWNRPVEDNVPRMGPSWTRAEVSLLNCPSMGDLCVTIAGIEDGFFEDFFEML